MERKTHLCRFPGCRECSLHHPPRKRTLDENVSKDTKERHDWNSHSPSLCFPAWLRRRLRRFVAAGESMLAGVSWDPGAALVDRRDASTELVASPVVGGASLVARPGASSTPGPSILVVETPPVVGPGVSSRSPRTCSAIGSSPNASRAFLPRLCALDDLSAT